MDFKKHYKAWIATTIVVASILSRILIQIPNVSAITTVAMMSGILLGRILDVGRALRVTGLVGSYHGSY
jgi:hypothetical protein